MVFPDEDTRVKYDEDRYEYPDDKFQLIRKVNRYIEKIEYNKYQTLLTSLTLVDKKDEEFVINV